MKPEARLDSAVFQLTPTRTRCDLVVISDGKKEKIASGLLSPFLAHLKSAQDQIAKGGYSITLQPDPGRDATWFTKGTVERFVRFVSTPEILERVNTIESEILQIEEAMAIQGNERLGSTTVEVHQKRLVECMEGSKPMAENDADKAIILYKPGADPPQTNGSNVETEHSKVQLMRVLETRRTVLQREQGMAFARAAAAGFDMDHMAHLVSFSECFGAARLRVACVKFMELWKGKHETGQWLEIEAAEALSMRSDLPPLNVPGIVFPGSNGDRSIDINGNEGNDDKRVPGNPQVPLAPLDYPQGQLQHPMLSQWPIHSPSGAAVFQPYPIQGIPYYPNYPSGSQFFQPPYNQTKDPRFNSKRRLKKNKHSSDSKESKEISDDSDAEEEVSNTRSPDSLEDEVSEGKSSRKRISSSDKKRSGVVVIRNINYITSKRRSLSGSEHELDSNSEMEDETDNSRRRGKGSLKSKAGQATSTESLNFNEGIQGEDTNADNWQVFQSFLLRNEENKSADPDMFSSEKGTLAKQRQLYSGMDPILQPDRDSADISDDRIVEFDTIDGKSVRKSRQMGPDAEMISSSGQEMPRDNQRNVEFREMKGGRAGYRKGNSDDFIIYGRGRQPNSRNSLDPLAENGVSYSGHGNRSPQTKITDESFLVPLRSHSEEPSGASRGALYSDTVTQANTQETGPTYKTQNQACYEPNDLSLMPERGLGSEPIGHDPAIYYDMEMHANKTAKSNGIQEDAVTSTNEGTKQDKLKTTRASQNGQVRKLTEAARRARPSKLNPPAEAQARAEKLRAFKADLQKVKREKEEEEIKRLEAMKRERQKRIAARGASSSAQRGTTQLQNRSHVPAKVTSNLHRGLKFSDAEPASSLPLQKFPIRRASTGSTISQKVSATSKLSSDCPSRNGLSRSASSLTEMKENKKITNKKTISVTRRLSDPKGAALHHSSLKSASTVQVSKPSPSDLKGKNSAPSLRLKSQKVDRFGKKNVSEEPQNKKISAIINLDKSKAATLPELKLRVPTKQIDVAQTKPNAKSTEKDKTPTPESSEGKNPTAKTSQSTEGDEGLIIEKTVVMLEKERFPTPVMASKERARTSELSRIEAKKEIGCKVARNLPPVTVNVPTKDPTKGLPSNQPTYEVAKDNLQKLSTFNPAEKPYQAPHARLSSMESMSDLDHSGVLPMTSDTVTKGPDTLRAPPFNFTAPVSVDQLPEITEKPRSKEPKGFKRLLKFGKRNQNSSNEEQGTDPGGSSFDGHATTHSSSCEVPSLKHLISEEDSNIGSGPSKASRTFSILSPFRSKSSEKKITV